MPDRETQSSICHEIDNALNENDVIIERVHREIVLLQEFRTRLVADVVTGQVDVRALAASLPDAPMPAASIDDATTDPDDPEEFNHE